VDVRAGGCAREAQSKTSGEMRLAASAAWRPHLSVAKDFSTASAYVSHRPSHERETRDLESIRMGSFRLFSLRCGDF
jgi:hypothetical protein